MQPASRKPKKFYDATVFTSIWSERLYFLEARSCGFPRKIEKKVLSSPANRALARKLADESMVLLKNDRTLLLKPVIKSIAVVGLLAD